MLVTAWHHSLFVSKRCKSIYVCKIWLNILFNANKAQFISPSFSQTYLLEKNHSNCTKNIPSKSQLVSLLIHSPPSVSLSFQSTPFPLGFFSAHDCINHSRPIHKAPLSIPCTHSNTMEAVWQVTYLTRTPANPYQWQVISYSISTWFLLLLIHPPLSNYLPRYPFWVLSFSLSFSFFFLD